jgi:hypothetical protein
MSKKNELYGLADIIGDKPANVSQIGKIAAARRVLDAGYRRARTITTIEELDALPVGSVILDPIGLSLHKNEFTGWRASNGATEITADMLQREALPATLIHEPEPTA